MQLKQGRSETMIFSDKSMNAINICLIDGKANKSLIKYSVQIFNSILLLLLNRR